MCQTVTFYLLSVLTACSTLFPYTTLFRSRAGPATAAAHPAPGATAFGRTAPGPARRDRKSIRLNSSHLGKSYAVFCLKKKIPRFSTHAMGCQLSSKTTVYVATRL